MTKFGELLGRGSESQASEDQQFLRQLLLVLVFFLLWYSDNVNRQWQRFVNTCGQRIASQDWRGTLHDLGLRLRRTLHDLFQHCRLSLMSLRRAAGPTFSCWPKPLQLIWFTPLATFLNLCLVVWTYIQYLVVEILPSFIVRYWQKFTDTMTNATSTLASRHFKHALSVMGLFGLISLIATIQGSVIDTEFNAFERYGVFMTIIIYFLQSLVFIPLPFFICNFLGVVFLNVFTPKPKLQRSPLIGPFLCFRVVTRGLYPNLVNDNVKHNIKICDNIGLHNYIFEVVTDMPIDLQEHPRSREIVVPEEYQTSKGSLFKARALQYALEPGVDILSPGDWIVHLDEETLLTEEAVIGIINFAGSAEYSFGQGVITYGQGQVVNWITTLADSIRVGIDYGCLRFSLGVLHKPIFSWKGSFIVADAQAEKEVSFDHGPEASIAEDCFFACVAFSKGHSFGIVEGEMLEKSTFTLRDFVRQRRRWMHGILLTALSRKLPLRYKVGPILMSVAGCTMPFNMLLLPLGFICPLPQSQLLMYTYNFVAGTLVYLFILGTLQSFSIKQHGLLKCCLLVVATILCGLIGSLLENISSILVFWTPTTKPPIISFYVVNKQVRSDCMKVL